MKALRENEMWKEQVRVVCRNNTQEINTISALMESTQQLNKRIKEGYRIVDQSIDDSETIFTLEKGTE